MEYIIIYGREEKEVERKINKFANEGWRVESFNTTHYGSCGIYIHVLMVKN